MINLVNFNFRYYKLGLKRACHQSLKLTELTYKALKCP
jgi:hypothetical protein